MDYLSSESRAKPTVFLVHGTWPRGILGRISPARATSSSLAWFDEGSSFRTEIEARLGNRVRFEVFNWSGRNSMRARAEAAEGLRTRLQAVQASSPKSGQLIVAHSHGGNVALAAITRLQSQTSLLGVAAMATPFLYLEERPFTAHERGVFHSLGVTMLFALMIPFAWLSWSVWRMPNAFGAFFTVFAATCLWCLPLATWKLSILPRMNHLLENTLSDALVPDVGEIPFLILRCPGDEASLALGLARTFAVANSFVWKILAVLHTKTFTSFAYFAIAWIVLAGLALITGTIEHSRPWVPAFILWPVALWLLAIPGGFIFSVLFSTTSGFLLLPFGAELWALAFKLKVRADARPPVAHCTQISVNPSAHRLRSFRHSVYEVAATREKLAEWITDRLPAPERLW
jgi:hypothetical protein